MEGIDREYYAVPFGDRYIWGITAGIVRNLYDGSTDDGARRHHVGRALAERRRRRATACAARTATARKRASSAALCAIRCWGLPVAEIDIATTALPEEVMRRVQAAGCKAVPTGIEHGTVTVIVAAHPFEVTTLREDVETYGRKARVVFGRDWRPTPNGATSPSTRCRSRATACPRLCRRPRRHRRAARALHRRPGERIDEDYLRILRFFRFHAHFGEGAARPGRACTPASRPRRPRDAVARARAHGVAQASARAARHADARGHGGERAFEHGVGRRRRSRELREHDQARSGGRPQSRRRAPARRARRVGRGRCRTARRAAAANQRRIRTAPGAGRLVACCAGAGCEGRACTALSVRFAILC